MFSLAILDLHHDLVFDYNCKVLFKRLNKIEGERVSRDTLMQTFTPLLVAQNILETEKNLVFQMITFGSRQMVFENFNGFHLIVCGKKSGEKLRLFLSVVKNCIGHLVAEDLEWLKWSQWKQNHLTKMISSWEDMVGVEPFRMMNIFHSLKVDVDICTRMEMALAYGLMRIPAELPAMASFIIKGKIFNFVTNRCWKDTIIDRNMILLHVYDITRRSSNGVLTKLFFKSNGWFIQHQVYVHKIFNNIILFVAVQSHEGNLLSVISYLKNYLASTDDSKLFSIAELRIFQKELSSFEAKSTSHLVNQLKALEDCIKHDAPVQIAKEKCQNETIFWYQKLTNDAQRNNLLGNFASMSSYIQGKFHFYWDWLVEEEEDLPHEVEQIIDLYGADVLLWFLVDTSKDHQPRMMEKFVSKFLSSNEVTEILSLVAVSRGEDQPYEGDRAELRSENFRILIMKMRSNKMEGPVDFLKDKKLYVAVRSL